MRSGPDAYRTILGIRFFQGSAASAVDQMEGGGVLVVPAAPALKDLETDAAYRDALVHADLAITDSSFMVLAWNFLQKDTLRRLSGLEYLRELLGRESARRQRVAWARESAPERVRSRDWRACCSRAAGRRSCIRKPCSPLSWKLR